MEHIKNYKEFQYLNESSLNRILNKHYNDGFIILLSYRFEKSVEQNNKDFQQLKKDIKNNNFSYIPVYGGFIENIGEENEVEVKEPFILITNYLAGSNKPYDTDNTLFNFGLELIKKYNQDSFLFKPKSTDKRAYYINKLGEIVDEFNDKTINDLTKIYFTDLEKYINKNGDFKDKTTKRFTFTNNVYINAAPLDLNDAKNRYGEHFFKL